MNTNHVVQPVDGLFAHLDTHGDHSRIGTGPWNPADGASCHFQGIARYGDYLLLSYDEPYDSSHESNGQLIVASVSQQKVVYVVPTPIAGYQHPGGMQVIGDYLVVGLEITDPVIGHGRPLPGTPQSYVVFYNLLPLAASKPSPPRYLQDLTIPRMDGKAGGVGITNWYDHGSATDVLAVYDNGACDFYTFPTAYLNRDKPSGFTPELAFSYDFSNTGYSTVSLLTDKTGQKWIIGFYMKGKWPTAEDWADLFRLSVDDSKIELVDSRHFIYDGNVYADGFRFTGGVDIDATNEDFSLLSSSSNEHFGHFSVNVFAAGSQSVKAAA